MKKVYEKIELGRKEPFEPVVPSRRTLVMIVSVMVLLLVLVDSFIMLNVGWYQGRKQLREQNQRIVCANIEGCQNFIVLSGTMVDDKMMVMDLAKWKMVQNAGFDAEWYCVRCAKSKGVK